MHTVTPKLTLDAMGDADSLEAMKTMFEPVSTDLPLDQTRAGSARIARCSPLAPAQMRFGRYEVVKKLGQGGMGVVYQAIDPVTGQDVALKVLSAGLLSQSDAMRRFEKEARLLEEAKNPHVANLLDVGMEGEFRYLVMEFVRGGDLRRWMKNVERVDETSALEVIGDLCRALVTAHAKGMVHRDIKPENVLLDDRDSSQRPTVKLTDFGLARHVDQTESLKLTQTGALLGTPYYMSPEQFTGAHDVSPATDVYALGVTFFELVAGRRPFTATDPIQLATAHCFDAPTDVRTLNPRISDASADLVRRMLAKHPGQRPPDASSVLEEILRIQSGDSSAFVVHPVLPTHDGTRRFEAEFEWELESSAEALWPFVSNTDRFNQAAGLPPITYETTTDSDGRIRKFGQFRLAGIAVKWEEHPFEWIEGQRFSVLREFPSGPFVWFMSSVELVSLPTGKTHLKHQVKIQPRGVFGHLMAQFEVGAKGKRNLNRIYRRIDATVSKRLSSNRVINAFGETSPLKRIQRQRLERRLDVWSAVGISTEIVDVFRELLSHAAPQDLARIQPYAVARRFDLPANDVVDACLRAVPLGLLTLHWDIICPSCRLAADAKGTLREIEQHANCSACQLKFDIEFGSSLELVFRVHPEVRSADAKTYCAGGPGNFRHVIAQVRMSPGERVLLPLSLKAGSYIARGPILPYAVPIEVDAEAGPRHGQIRCVPGSNRTPLAVMRAGSQSLAIENFFPNEQLVRIERTASRSDALTAAHATALPVFRELFPEQSLSPGMLIEIATSNFLAIQIARFDDLFEELGDSGAYSHVQDFQRIAERQIQRRGGVMVDCDSGAVLASFSDPVVALQAARELWTALTTDRAWDRPLSGALHQGAALVTGDRHEVRYFGATINRTRQLARAAAPHRLLLTPEIWADPGVMTAYQDEIHLVAADTHKFPDSIRQIGLNPIRV
ncbi:protein kinase domain-containing protein [Schlesneria paludicola]|uniref:protein kinase domain-containing protein n=1 Tax=Schlesneria paludicola TaxID=360056 RepID=UPI00029A7CAC|nr:protein kinase [Schlesneria paludicola]